MAATLTRDPAPPRRWAPAARPRSRRVLAWLPGLGVLGLLVVALVLGGEPGVLVAGATAGLVVVSVLVHQKGAAVCASASFAVGVLTTTWNGVAVGGLQVGDVFFAVALVLLLPAVVTGSAASPRLPLWLVVPATLVSLVALSHLVFPVDTSYLLSRFQRVDPFVKYGGETARLSGNGVNALRWLVSLVALPLLAVLVGRLGRLRVDTLARSWVLGVTVSAAVSISDYVGLTHISSALLPIVDVGGRQAGLAGHPNQLAVSIVVATPFAVWLFLARREGWAAGAVVVMLAGTLLSGSRGGALAAVAGLVVALLVLVGVARVSSSRSLWLLLPLLAAPFLSLLVFGESIAGLSNRDSSTELASNAERRSTTGQGITDWFHSPFRGVGLQVVSEAHDIVLQLLASGGVLLAVAGLVFAAGSLRTAWSSRRSSSGLSLAVGVSVLDWIAVGLVENQLTDRYLYVPVCLLLIVAITPLRTTDDEQHLVGAVAVPKPTGEMHAAQAHRAAREAVPGGRRGWFHPV